MSDGKIKHEFSNGDELGITWDETRNEVIVDNDNQAVMLTYMQARQLRLMLDCLFTNPYDR